MTRFEAAASIVIGAEGPRSADPRDSGGLTVYGHDEASWPDLLRRVPPIVRAALPASVADLSRDQAILAYRAGYWDFVRGDALPPTIALLAFDAAVNQGTTWTPRALQAALGVTPDGEIGPVTVAATGRADWLDLIGELSWRRGERYAQCVGFDVFGHGWITRLARVVALATTYDLAGASGVTVSPHLPHVGAATVP